MEVNENLKAALYIRVSTEEQAIDGQSPSAQEETLRQYCSAFGINVFDTYMDLGFSGKSLRDRSELKRLVKDCGEKKFDIVLVWKISRLSRNLKDLLYLIDIFESNNVHFASCSEKFDTSTPVGLMTLQLLGSIAEFERNTIVENVKLGLREFARKGGKSTSLLGYDNVDKRLVINEKEARIVKLIFSLYAEASMSCSAIAGYLNSLGLKTKRGSDFRGSSISYIVHNPVYIGINRHCMKTENQYSVKGTHPAIIDDELWRKAQEKSTCSNKNKAIGKKSFAATHFKVYCKSCKMVMRVFYACSKGKKYKYMRCCSCSNYINEEKLIKAVYDVILGIINDNSKQREAYRLISKYTFNQEPSIIEAASIDAEIKRIEKSKARYINLFEDYKISDSKTFLDRISELDLRLELLKRRKDRILSGTAVCCQPPDYEGYFNRLKDRLSTEEPSLLGQLSECLIERIEAYKGEIEIFLYL